MNARAGLAYCNNDPAPYRRLLARLVGQPSDVKVRFEAALANGDQKAPMRLAHTLKGGAGTVGARAVQAATTDLEASCREASEQERLAARLEAVDLAQGAGATTSTQP